MIKVEGSLFSVAPYGVYVTDCTVASTNTFAGSSVELIADG